MEIQNYKECLSYLQYSFKNIQNGLECSSNLFPTGPVKSKCCNNAMVCFEAKFCPLVVSNFYDNTRQGTSNVFRLLRQRIVDKPFFHRAGGRFLTNQEQRKGFKEQQGINRSPSNSWQGARLVVRLAQGNRQTHFTNLLTQMESHQSLFGFLDKHNRKQKAAAT